jgi:hypothetical protein
MDRDNFNYGEMGNEETPVIDTFLTKNSRRKTFLNASGKNSEDEKS